MAAFSSYTLFNSSILFLYNSSFASVYTFIGGERHLLSSVGMCSWSKSQFLHSFLLTLLHTLCIFAILIDSFPFNQIHLFLALLCVIWFLIVEWSPPIRWYYSDSDPIVFSIQNGGIFFLQKENTVFWCSSFCLFSCSFFYSISFERWGVYQGLNYQLQVLILLCQMTDFILIKFY